MKRRILANKAFAVGLLVAVSFAAFLVAFTFFRKGGYSERESYQVHAYFKDATGLTWKSRVQIAGIPIGEVARISLQGNRARLDLRIKNEVDLRKNACLSKRFPSALLPDALLDTIAGTPDFPSMKSLPVEEREITCIKEGTTVEALLESLSGIAKDVQGLTGELRETVAGSQGSIKNIVANIEHVSAGLAQTTDEGTARIQAILRNTQEFTGTLRDVAAEDKGRYHAIARNIEEASAKINALLDTVQGIVGDKGGDVQQSVAGIRQSLDKLNRSMDEVEKVAVSIGEGKGVAGKLLADERLGNKVGTAIEGASDYVDKLVKLKLEVNLRSEWLAAQNGSKTYFGLRIIPRPDKYYILQLVNDPRGVDTITNETLTTQAGGTTSTTVTSRTVNEKRLSFTAEFAKRYGPLALRVGIIESSGGGGFDYYLFDDRLSLSAEIFQFDRPQNVTYPYMKVWANYTFLRFLFATVGTDDVLNRWRSGHYPGGRNFAFGRDVFFGGGLVFTDDDLKTLVGAIGSGASAVPTR